jgi:hypothetical protein
MDGGQMNIDERLEALTHTVELLAGLQMETEKKLARLTETMATLADGMIHLTRVALDHTERIENLEGNRPL